jgi:hypothetical protein
MARTMADRSPVEQVSFAARPRDVWRRLAEPLPESERVGRWFARRIVRALATDLDVPLLEYFRLYRLVVPYSSNGRGGPRALEEAWRARQHPNATSAAIELGYITPRDLEFAGAERRRELKTKAYIARLGTARRRVRRNEQLLVACERRITGAGLAVPDWLRRSEPDSPVSG